MSESSSSRPSAKDMREQIAEAQAEVATWSPEKRASVQLEGGADPAIDAARGASTKEVDRG